MSSCVRLNNLTTDCFDVTCGLQQGCCLSPLHFNLFINDLAFRIKALGKGVMVDEGLICILIYADDIVLLSENANDLQLLLDCLNEWCGMTGMSVNASKGNIMHFRSNSVPGINYNFKCGVQTLSITDRYTYLGITLNEFLDYNVTPKTLLKVQVVCSGFWLQNLNPLRECHMKCTRNYIYIFWVPESIHPQPQYQATWAGNRHSGTMLNNRNASVFIRTEWFTCILVD